MVLDGSDAAPIGISTWDEAKQGLNRDSCSIWDELERQMGNETLNSQGFGGNFPTDNERSVRLIHGKFLNVCLRPPCGSHHT